MNAAIAVLLSVGLAGCASGPFFWTRADATPEAFNTDHAECAKGATIGYGVGSEKAYKACMSQKGWTRVRGSGSQPPDVPHFRGIEGDDEFATAPPPARPVTDVKELAGTWRASLTTRFGQVRALMVIQEDGSYEASAGTALTRGNFYLESGKLRYRSTRSEGTAKLSDGRMSLTITPDRRFSPDTEEAIFERVK